METSKNIIINSLTIDIIMFVVMTMSPIRYPLLLDHNKLMFIIMIITALVIMFLGVPTWT